MSMSESARFEVVERRSAGYKSWKKKYRKMRIVFDQKMHEGEELHKQEAKATALVKRIAIENDRLLDLLLEVNNSPQIPPERRIHLAVKPSSDSRDPCLPMDRDLASNKPFNSHSHSHSNSHSHSQTEGAAAAAGSLLDHMIRDVPHSTYSASKASNAPSLADLNPPDGEAHPASFLSPDDVDNYLYLLDAKLDAQYKGPTLATLAHPQAHPPPNPAFKNPTSVTNWLRKHAPKIFLQDGEPAAHEGPGDEADHHHAHAHTFSHKDKDSNVSAAQKKPRSSGARAERGRASAKSKRASSSGGGGGAAAARSSAAAAHDWDASHDDEHDSAVTPVPRAKRKRDDDAGYRPRGSGGRPSKKKRKDKDEATPPVRKSHKKDAGASKHE